MSVVYNINKGVNKSPEFKGLKAQYIWWLGGGLIGMLVLFAILYVLGVNTFITLGIALGGATWVIVFVYRLSNTYGEHGMMKKAARRRVPDVVKSYSRKAFFEKNEITNSIIK